LIDSIFSRSLLFLPYHSYFERGVFAFNCTCHNDLGWLNTQKKTADFRSADQPLPDGSLQFSVGPWEIVTLKVAV